ncbi:MAG: zinc-regulated TonB-dependent outer membrane receptor [Myxococcota bacterium]|nr:zinc-regulated TonB-dependent outer membrane receptor [Myxococcota bacterium]
MSALTLALAASAQTTRAEAEPSGAQSLNPDISAIADFALAAFSEPDHHQTGGHDPAENGFNLQALELSLGSSVDPYFRFDAQLVFGEEGVELEEAYATTLDLGARLQARAGQFLTRFGRLNSTHLHAWNFVDQPFALGRVFGGDGNRGLGLELSWLAPLPWYVELVASATQVGEEATARSFAGEDGVEVEGPEDLLYVAALKQFFPLSNDWSLAFGVSGALGPNGNQDGDHVEVYGLDAYLKYRPLDEAGRTELTLQTEWLLRRRELEAQRLLDAGGYAELVVRFARRYALGARYELGSPSYDEHGDAVVDPRDPEWMAARTRVSAQATFLPSEFSRLRLQGSRDSAFSQPVWAAFLAAEFAIGAHGAHRF